MRRRKMSNQLNELVEKVNKMIIDDGLALRQKKEIYQWIQKEISGLDVKDINWEIFLKNLRNKKKNPNYIGTYIKYWVYLLIELDKCDLCGCHYKGCYLKYEKDLRFYVDYPFVNKDLVFLEEGVRPFSFIKVNEFNKSTNETSRCLIVKNINEEQRCFIVKYMDSLENFTTVKTLMRHGLNEMLNAVYEDDDGKYKYFSEFNDSSFEKHFFKILKTDYHSKDTRINKSILSTLIKFYLYIQSRLNDDQRKKQFSIYNSRVLAYRFIIDNLADGYAVVKLSVYDEIPAGDKFLIDAYNNSNNTRAINVDIICLNLSDLKNYYTKTWIKDYFWHNDDHLVYIRKEAVLHILQFFRTIQQDFKEDEIPFIKIEHVLEYKSFLINTRNLSPSQISKRLTQVKYFLKFVQENYKVNIENGVFEILKYSDENSICKKEAYTKKEVEQLLLAYKDNAEKHNRVEYYLYYYLTKLMTILPIRKSNLLNIQINSWKTIEDSIVLTIPDKTSKYCCSPYILSEEALDILEEVKEITRDCRESSFGDERNFLFIYKQVKFNSLTIVKGGSWSVYHHNICKKYGIRDLRIRALRKYFQTKVSTYLEKEGLSSSLLPHLARHGSDVHYRHYQTFDIREYCYENQNLEIGEFEMEAADKGVNVSDDSYNENNKYEAEHFNCYMCENFVYTKDTIEEILEEKEKVDKRLKTEIDKKERNFLETIKKLYEFIIEKFSFEEERKNVECTE